jgi:hypothetical protein
VLGVLLALFQSCPWSNAMLHAIAAKVSACVRIKL